MWLVSPEEELWRGVGRKEPGMVLPMCLLWGNSSLLDRVRCQSQVSGVRCQVSESGVRVRSQSQVSESGVRCQVGSTWF